MDVSTDSEVQFRNGAAVQSFTEDHDETSGDDDDTLTHGVAGLDADDEDSRSGHAHFSEDYMEEAESDVEGEPPRMKCPQPHPLAWTPRMPRITPDHSGVHGLAIEGQGGKGTGPRESKAHCEL